MKRLFAFTSALLLTAFIAAGCAALDAAGWVTLIDGEKGMENWNQVGDANWRAEGGAIVADKGKGGFLMSKKSYKDFSLYIEFWADHTANSGIYMRCQDAVKVTDLICYEANIFDQRPDPLYGTGAIVHRVMVNPMPKAAGRWSTYEIHMKGTQLTVKLNGVVTAFMDDKDFASGPFGLQFANRGKEPGGVIKFRKVLIREL
jgi:hypothetical protein